MDYRHQRQHRDRERGRNTNNHSRDRDEMLEDRYREFRDPWMTHYNSGQHLHRAMYDRDIDTGKIYDFYHLNHL